MIFNDSWECSKIEPWIYKWGFVHSTHDAGFYVDENKKIVWVACDKILLDWNTIWKQTPNMIPDYLWNNIIFWINNARDSPEVIIDDLNIVYKRRIEKVRLKQFIKNLDSVKNAINIDKSIKWTQEKDTSGEELIDLEITKQWENYSIRWASIDPEYTKDMQSRIIPIRLASKRVLENMPSNNVQNKLNTIAEFLIAENKQLLLLKPLYCEYKNNKSWK